MRLALAVSSLATLVLLGLAALRENYLTEWRGQQREYRRILLASAETEADTNAARGFRVRLRQIVVPELDAVDRCVTCHLGLDDPRMNDAPQPFTTHPGSYLQDHDVDKFGCTICHDGQGRATTRNEAHATSDHVYWDRALLPAPFNQATCGLCHDPQHLADRGAPALAHGLELLRTKGCLGCHKLGGRGGLLGPTLDGTGDKGRHALPFAHVSGERQVWNWHVQHFRDPAEVVADSKMPQVDLAESEVDELTTYMLSLRDLNLVESLISRDRYEQRYRVWHTSPLSGHQLYQQFCFACHEEGMETVLHDSLETGVPSVRNPDFLSVIDEEFLVTSIRDGRPGTTMPAWGAQGGGLSDDEIRRLSAYLLESRAEEREITFTLADRGDAERGSQLFTSECTECHSLGPDGGEAPWLAGSGFQDSYSDALIAHTIAYGREDTLMIPYWEEADGDYGVQDITDLVAYIRSLR